MGEPTDRRLVSKTGENQVRLLAPMRSATSRGKRVCTLLIQQWEAYCAASRAARIPALPGRQEACLRPGRTPVMGMTARERSRLASVDVVGSIPTFSTRTGGRVRVSAPGLGPGRRGSSPCFPTHGSLAETD